MEQNKYFKPSIEDIRVGYECEFLKDPSKEPHEQEWIPMVLKNSKPNWTMNYGMSIGSLRVPYLTKEQIEAEGWAFVKDERSLLFDKGDLRLGFNQGILSREDGSQTYVSSIHLFYPKTGSTIISCMCKDINTFRYICKLLNIK